MVLATRKMHLIITHVLSVYTHVRLKVQPTAIPLYPWLLWSQSFIVATYPLNVYTSSKLFTPLCCYPRCQLSSDAKIYALIIPMVITLFFNFIIAILVVHQLVSRRVNRIKKDASLGRTDSTRKKHFKRAKLSLSLISLLGLTWVFGLLMLNSAALTFQYIFTILNTAQGLIIFVFYCALRAEVRREWKKALWCFRRSDEVKIKKTCRLDVKNMTPNNTPCTSVESPKHSTYSVEV